MKLFFQRITLVFTSQGTCSQSKYTRFQNTGYCGHYKNCIDFYVSVLQVFACKTCNPLFFWELYCISTCNVHIQKHSSKKQISFFFFTVYYRRYSRNTVYSMIQQKTFYSIVYCKVNKISMNKKATAKSPVKREN